MSNTLKYRPWKLYIYFIPFLIFCGLVFVVAASSCFSVSLLSNFFVYLSLGALSFVQAKVLYDSYNVVILFLPQAMEITEKKHSRTYNYKEQRSVCGYYHR